MDPRTGRGGVRTANATHAARTQAAVRARHVAASSRMRRQRPRRVPSARTRQPMDDRRRGLSQMDRRAPARRARSLRRHRRSHLRGLRSRRHAPIRGPDQATHFAGCADEQGIGSRDVDRLGDERRAAAAASRIPATPGRRRLARFRQRQVAEADPGPGQDSRRAKDGRPILSRALRPPSHPGRRLRTRACASSSRCR